MEMFEPVSWKEYFILTEYISYGIPIYLTKETPKPKDIIFFAIHGAGLCA